MNSLFMCSLKIGLEHLHLIPSPSGFKKRGIGERFSEK
jgi:hypothetical protein